MLLLFDAGSLQLVFIADFDFAPLLSVIVLGCVFLRVIVKRLSWRLRSEISNSLLSQ